jgi:hypothetical protein
LKVDFSKRVDPDAKVYEFPSESRSDVIHTVVVSRQGARCTCEGWQYRQMCKHVQQVPAYRSEDAGSS